MKLFPAKCHERATLRKLWRQTGNSSLLPAKCWPLLHVIAGISARFSNFAFVLFCYITNHLMTGPLGNSEFCFPRISMFPPTSSRETLRFSGNKIHCSPRDQSLSVNCLTFFGKLKLLRFFISDYSWRQQSTAKAHDVFLPALVLKRAFFKVAFCGITGMVRTWHHWHSEGAHQIYLGAAFYATDGRT